MPLYRFTIRLTSDAEPGTGLGGELVNQLIPRDEQGRPVLPASHLKGLMRATLREMADVLEWPAELERRVFGGSQLPEDVANVGVEAAFQLTSAQLPSDSPSVLVTRTAIDEGTRGASEGTLRTTEAVPVGTVFTGQLRTSLPAGCAEDLAWRLALLSLRAVGGSRTRGCGECFVELENETRSPGDLLRLLCQVLRQPDWKDQGLRGRIAVADANRQPTGPASATDPSSDAALSSDVAIVRLVFLARTPICCPEIPDKTNVIATGFSIPASAVQGAILSRLNARDPALATAVFEHPAFRAWPLHPCGRLPATESSSPDDGLPAAIRVSLTHRAAKFTLGRDYQPEHFVDEAIEDYDWRTVPGGAPLKASDGVLLRCADGRVLLWRAADMPHTLTAHGVHGSGADERHLFSVDAMAPLIWTGLVVMPKDAAEQLAEELAADPHVALGKSRSIRGLGELRATIVDGLPAEWETSTERTVLVVQSPLLLPDVPREGRTLEEELHELATAWARESGLPPPEERSWCNLGLRFGWSRHARGRQRACRVVLPGSVIVFSEKLPADPLVSGLIRGVGREGRQRGFGAVSVHPGKATALFRPEPQLERPTGNATTAFREAVRLVLKIRDEGRTLPSPSQIRAVQQRLEKAGAAEALTYLESQTRRTSRIWFTWEDVHQQVSTLLSDYDGEVASRALAVLANLAIADQQGDRNS